MSDLSRSLVDAAAEALPVAFCESMRIPESKRGMEGGRPEDWQAEARAAVAAVLETLAARAHWLKPDNSDGFVTAVEVNEALRRLAVEAKEGR